MRYSILFLIVGLFFFQSCKDCSITELDDPNALDCPELLLNIGAACDDGNPDTADDVVTANCQCVGIGEQFDCPDLGLNIGDPCDDGNPNTSDDAINGNCECVGGGIEYDCPDLLLNIGNACNDNDDTTINDIVTDNCLCVGESIFDCPDLGLNIGDTCDDGNPATENDIVDDMCACVGESIFDCPDLGLNIGDACDDGNPDTENDIVDNMCICLGEIISTCNGVLYASRITNNGSNIESWFFDSANIADGNPLPFNVIEEKTNNFLQVNEGLLADFSAYDPIGNQYAFAYAYSDPTIVNPLYLAEAIPFSSQFLNQPVSYAAPVFLNGKLYAIDIAYDQPSATYTIKEINQQTGTTTTLFSQNTMVNTIMVNGITSSASNHTDEIYFISGANLIAYKPSTNTATWQDIDFSNDPDLQNVYAGLEYRAADNQLLAFRGLLSNGTNTIGNPTLVTINSTGAANPTAIFDIKSNLGQDNDEAIYFLFNSTTYSPCANSYYISEPVALDGDDLESFMIKIDLDENTLTETRLDDIIYGLELVDE